MRSFHRRFTFKNLQTTEPEEATTGVFLKQNFDFFLVCFLLEIHCEMFYFLLSSEVSVCQLMHIMTYISGLCLHNVLFVGK